MVYLPKLFRGLQQAIVSHVPCLCEAWEMQITVFFSLFVCFIIKSLLWSNVLYCILWQHITEVNLYLLIYKEAYTIFQNHEKLSSILSSEMLGFFFSWRHLDSSHTSPNTLHPPGKQTWIRFGSFCVVLLINRELAVALTDEKTEHTGCLIVVVVDMGFQPCGTRYQTLQFRHRS